MVRGIAMSKQDRQGVRTFEQLMRRFNLDGIDENVVAEMFKQISQVNEHLTSLGTTVTQKLNILLSSNQTWFYGGVPVLESYPAKDWTDNTQKDSHIGDFYYDTDNENVYIFTKCDDVYEWKSCFSGGCDVDHEALRQEGYDEGYNNGYATGHQKGYENGEIDGYSKGYTDGQEERSNPLEYANSLRETFKDVVFSADELTLDLPKITSCESAFYNASGIKKITLKGNERGNIIRFHQAFRGCASLETLDLTEFNAKTDTIYMMFYMCTAIREILSEIDFTECTTTTYAFQGCTNLETFTPKANSIKISIGFPSSSKLSATSIQSIFDGLATVETAQTLTLPKTLSTEAESVVSANIEEIDGEIRIKGKEGWTLAR